MDKRHQDTLTSRLEDAYLNGCSPITQREIYCWYGVEKIAARTWRDLEVRWQEVTDNNLGCLMKIEGRGGIFIFGKNAPEPIDSNNPVHTL